MKTEQYFEPVPANDRRYCCVCKRKQYLKNMVLITIFYKAFFLCQNCFQSYSSETVGSFRQKLSLNKDNQTLVIKL